MHRRLRQRENAPLFSALIVMSFPVRTSHAGGVGARDLRHVTQRATPAVRTRAPELRALLLARAAIQTR